MRTLEITIAIDDSWQELLIAELTDLDFEGFWQEDDAIKAYIPVSLWDDTHREQVEQWLARRGLPVRMQERVIEEQNWNRKWEETIKPLAVGPFLVRPTWAETPARYKDLILLEIDPKMSFGTGYHESTRLALRFLPDLIQGGERVLDAGTGTGILAIAALKLGAATAIAFDIDEWSQQNAQENFYLNGVADLATVRGGSISVVPERDFDLVLANINRNVLIDLMPGFAVRLRGGGTLVLAGLLQSDRQIMIDATAAHQLEMIREATEGEWWSAVFRKQ